MSIHPFLSLLITLHISPLKIISASKTITLALQTPGTFMFFLAAQYLRFGVVQILVRRPSMLENLLEMAFRHNSKSPLHLVRDTSQNSGIPKNSDFNT